MARIEQVEDREEIAAFLRRDEALQLYLLGDLDELFWPHATYYGLRREDELIAVALIYASPGSGPVLLAFEPEVRGGSQLLRALAPSLPRRFYAHLSPHLLPALNPSHRFEPRGLYHKMELCHWDRVKAVEVGNVEPLGSDALDDILGLLADSYPDHAFDPYVLQTGHTFGVRDGRDLIAVGGVHVVSQTYRVAALGNVATHSAQRGRGHARAVVAAIVRSLRVAGIETIGLNVAADNAAAIRCYESLGYEKVGEYLEGEWSALA